MTLHIDKHKTGGDFYPYEVPDAVSGRTISYQSAMDVYLVGGLDVCGCGDPGSMLAVVVQLMKAINEHGNFYEAQKHGEWPEGGWVQLVLNVLEHAKWLEHGSAIQGGWLTPAGKLALEDMEKILEAES